ncbi:MAG: FKBP-type peptidyl-prolyl cis-trans isomerase [Patescibacteria group bacterium]
MNKIVIVTAVSAAILLASCGKSAETAVSPTSGTPAGVTTAAADRTVKDGDTVAVDYLGKLEDGTVFDTSIKSEAEKTPKYNPNRDYSPLLFTVGAGQMIKGFDKGVLGMKVGEKKTLRLPPEEAYGTGGTEEVVPKKAFDDKFTETVSRDKYQDVVDIQVPETTFKDQGREIPKLGETITAGGVSAKVTKIADGKISLQVENRQNPFYGKKLAVGLEADFEGNKVKIVKLTDKDVTVEVTNLVSPFYGKKLVVGLEALYNGDKFTVKKIDKDTVTLERAHELSGKTLVFEVELKEIK